MNRRRGQVYVVGVLMLTALMVGGCNNDPDPVVTPSPTPTPTPTETAAPSPSPTPTELTPEEVEELLPEGTMHPDLFGAFSYASALVVQSRAMIPSGDWGLFEAMSTPQCTFCANTLQYAKSLKDSGETLSGGQITIVSELPQGGLQEDGLWHLEFEMIVEHAVINDSAGGEIAEVPERNYRVAVEMSHNGDHWEIHDVGSERLS